MEQNNVANNSLHGQVSKPGNQNQFILIVAVMLVLLAIIGVLIIILLKNGNSSNSSDTNDTEDIADQNGDQDLNNAVDEGGDTNVEINQINGDVVLNDIKLILPTGWEVKELIQGKSTDLVPNNCYGGSYADGNTCTVYILKLDKMPNYEVALSTPGYYSFGNGFTPSETINENIEFLGESINVGFNYEVTTTPTPNPHSVNFCNSNYICLSVDFRLVSNSSDRVVYENEVRSLIRDLRAL